MSVFVYWFLRVLDAAQEEHEPPRRRMPKPRVFHNGDQNGPPWWAACPTCRLHGSGHSHDEALADLAKGHALVGCEGMFDADGGAA